ncbi:MAG: MFS transporter [Halodesulfurarchaeum sp.]
MDWRYRHTALTLCTLAFFGTMVARLVISPVVPDITNQFTVSNGLIGLALSGMWVAYAMSQFPSGLLGDKYGERKVMLTAVGGTAVTSLGLAISPSFPVFFVSTVLLGAAAGLHYTVATTYLTRQFDNIGRAIGVHVAGGPLAGLVAPVAAVLVASWFGWRAGIALGLVVAVPVFVAFWFTIQPTEPRRPDTDVRDRLNVGAITELISRPQIAYTVALAVMGAFTWQATASFLPTFLEVYHGLHSTTAGILFSGYFVISGIAQPVLGSVSDRYSREPVILVTMLSGLIGYGALVRGDSLVVIVLGVFFVGIAMSWGSSIQSRFMDNLSDSERGSGFGLIRTTYMSLGATGSVAVGAVSDVFGWYAAFGLLAGIMALGTVAVMTNRGLGLGY